MSYNECSFWTLTLIEWKITIVRVIPQPTIDVNTVYQLHILARQLKIEDLEIAQLMRWRE